MIGEIYTLTDEEFTKVKAFARAVDDANKRDGLAGNGTYGIETTLAMNERGWLGEFACRKILGIPVGDEFFVVHPRRAADDNHDFSYRGKTFDSKSIRHRWHRLIVQEWKIRKHWPDGFALVMGDGWGPYSFRGFMAAGELFQPWRVKDLGYGRDFCADQEEMREFDEIWKERSG